MHGRAMLQSARLAGEIGAFPEFEVNREAMLKVVDKHHEAVSKIETSLVPLELLGHVRRTWDECVRMGTEHGYRNSQLTVLAPTGTIAFMMDCDTTGVEPDIALVKYKKLVGGGMLKIVNRQVPAALERLGYDKATAARIEAFVEEHDTIEGAPGLLSAHLPVFDCAFAPANGERSIHYLGHLRMMAAVQPFLSGAISKTVNLPHSATAAEITQTFRKAWELGVKAVAVYRDGCKRIQPLNVKRDKHTTDAKDAKNDSDGRDDRDENGTSDASVRAASGDGGIVPLASAPALEESIAATALIASQSGPQRRHLPDERQALTHKFSVAGHEGFVTVGMYDDGVPGELFITMAKEGSTIAGLLDSLATTASLALQHGVPLAVLCDKLSHTRYEPSGFTSNKDIRFAKSITDYIFRWLSLRFLAEDVAPSWSTPAPAGAGGTATTGPTATLTSGSETAAAGTARSATATGAATGSHAAPVTYKTDLDTPPCHSCGSLMVRNGACHKCPNCGETSGCS